MNTLKQTNKTKPTTQKQNKRNKISILPGAMSTKPLRMVPLLSIGKLKITGTSKAGLSEANATPKSRRNKHECKTIYALVIFYVSEKQKRTNPRPKGCEAFWQC